MALNQEMLGVTIGPFIRKYDWRDLILYALSVGAGFDDLQYCREDQLKVLPSYALAVAFEFYINFCIQSGGNQAAGLQLEQEISFHHPIPSQGTMTTAGSITHMYDRGKDKGALVLGEADTFHDKGQKLFTNKITHLWLLDGGFGGQAPPKMEGVLFPERVPDFEEEAFTSPNQTLLYRLSAGMTFRHHGLHVNPEQAKAAGFNRPVMHGSCTYGFAFRALIKHLCPQEPEQIKHTKARFKNILHPGDPITTQIWKIAENKALFRTINTLSGEVVLDKGMVRVDT